MTIHVHKLEGCSPTPLAHYLKALAVLRLVSEQRDAEVRGWWREEAFWLSTILTRENLTRFFLETYQPTPILSPWNGGSGFYYESDAGLTPLEQSSAPRFEQFRIGVASARASCAPLTAAIARLREAGDALKRAGGRDEALKAANSDAQTEKDAVKGRLLAQCRRTWSGGLLEWLDAAVAIGTDGGASWPALLGSGGNDGRLDFTNNSMQHLASLFDLRSADGIAYASARPLLDASLFGSAAPGLSDKAAGQFVPGSAGGNNMCVGFEGGSRINPWDFVLMLEGTVVLSTSIARSADAAGLAQAAAPFAVRPSASGYGSAASADEGPRGEQWMPLWSKPGRYPEVHALFAEGRVRVGRSTATRAVDVARGLSRLGAARGISEFERYGYIERNGQANLAVPIGRWAVSSQPRAELLDDITVWVRTFGAFAHDKLAPKAVAAAARMVDEAILGVCRAGSDPLRWQALLVALGHAETALLGSPSKVGDPKRKLSPLPALRPAWLNAANDGSAEFRLAAALASQDVVLHHEGRETFANIRAHWLPLDRSRVAWRAYADRRPARFATLASGLAHDPDVVCRGNDLERDCVALVRRRVQIAPTLSTRGLGLAYARVAGASIADVSAFLTGAVDDTRILSLARPLMAIAWWDKERPMLPRPPRGELDAIYAVVRIAHLSEPLDRGEAAIIRLDPEPTARLVAGDLAGAVAVCLRRLRASGLSPTIRVVGGSERYARRLAASLAFPIHAGDASRCVDLVTKPFEFEESAHG
jgi:CRISPR-associated protein Csx17